MPSISGFLGHILQQCIYYFKLLLGFFCFEEEKEGENKIKSS